MGEGYDVGVSRQVAPIARSTTRWNLADLEDAIYGADQGNMMLPGKLARAIRRDGVAAGVISTRTEGLVQLPRRFQGRDEYVDALSNDFSRVFPSTELALISGDGRVLGVGVGELVQVGGALPVLRRLEPEFLLYHWAEDRWYYQSARGRIPVNPGDGRWVLHIPGGAVNPWSNALWPALGRAYIAKEHAYFFRENFSSKLANSARVAKSPGGANPTIRQNFFAKLAAWSSNTVFELPPGWDVSLLESNGRGFEVFNDTIESANKEIATAVTGQTVTTDGGAGFQNSNIHATIRSDLIQADAEALSATLNTQAIPVWANERFGAGSLGDQISVSWDTTPPKDRTAEAAAFSTLGTAISMINQASAGYGVSVDVVELARRFGVPMRNIEAAAAASEPIESGGPGGFAIPKTLPNSKSLSLVGGIR